MSLCGVTVLLHWPHTYCFYSYSYIYIYMCLIYIYVIYEHDGIWNETKITFIPRCGNVIFNFVADTVSLCQKAWLWFEVWVIWQLAWQKGNAEFPAKYAGNGLRGNKTKCLKATDYWFGMRKSPILKSVSQNEATKIPMGKHHFLTLNNLPSYSHCSLTFKYSYLQKYRQFNSSLPGK